MRPLAAGCAALAAPALYLPLALTVSAQDASLEALAAQTDPERKAIVDELPQYRDDLCKLVSEHGTARKALDAYRAACYLSAARRDDKETVRDLWAVGNSLYKLNDVNSALNPLNQALQLSTKIGERQTVADSLQDLASCNHILGRFDEAEQLIRRCIAAYGELGDKHQVVGMTVNPCKILGEKGDQEAEAEILRRIIRESRPALMIAFAR